MTNESSQNYWNELARSIHFEDEKNMWEALYVAEARSISDLAKVLGFGTATVARRLQMAGVVKRGRGGRQTPARVHFKLFHLDQRYVRMSSIAELAKLCDSSFAAVYKKRKEL